MSSEVGTLGPLPRRQVRQPSGAGHVAQPPPMRFESFPRSRARILARLVAAAVVVARGAAAVCVDAILLRNTRPRRAVHLRRMFERMGGAFLVIGRQIGVALDLLQSPYGDELSRMVDAMDPFPVAEAIGAIERATGRPLQDTFAQFDPEPIASRVTACLYQAILRSGEKVVAKVRRPGIGERAEADLAVVDSIAWVLENLTVLKPGATRRVRADLRESLLEEIDFVREARHQDAFRRATKKDKEKSFTAPRVYFALSS